MTPWPLTDPIPQVCFILDVLRILRMSKATFHRRMHDKQLPIVELPKLGRARRFSGESIERLARARVRAS
jgi:predicted DNA-binding transcriptional regulator AlpA